MSHNEMEYPDEEYLGNLDAFLQLRQYRSLSLEEAIDLAPHSHDNPALTNEEMSCLRRLGHEDIWCKFESYRQSAKHYTNKYHGCCKRAMQEKEEEIKSLETKLKTYRGALTRDLMRMDRLMTMALTKYALLLSSTGHLNM
ncbi:hypothetical protein PT974_05580 [Cladobotryum mycophilum]|uniref:Uncharacterized protein n=1 Tax=Cladobotryum mycophilum TaxID=491253 RepID=A0ABR0SK84_9HYPO